MGNTRALILTGLLIGLTATAAEFSRPPAAVRLATVEEVEAAPLMRVPGTVFSQKDAKVAAEVRGRLVEVSEVGVVVRGDDSIATIDDRDQVLALADTEAEIRRLKANLNYLTRETDRLRRLLEVNVAARTQLDQMSSQRLMAEQDLAKAEIDREKTLYALERTNVQAPFRGQIVERLAEPGEFINVGQPIVRLVNTRSVEVRAQSPLRVAPFIYSGLMVRVEGNRKEVDLPITTVVPVGESGSRSFELRITLPENLWVIGTPVKVQLPTDNTRRVLAVPRDALVLRANGISVFRVNGDNVAERITVTTGIGVDDRIEVMSDLTVGDKVVVRGAERLRDGQVVDVGSS